MGSDVRKISINEESVIVTKYNSYRPDRLLSPCVILGTDSCLPTSVQSITRESGSVKRMVTQFSLEQGMLQTKVVKKINTHCMINTPFPENRAFYEICGKILNSRTGHRR